MGVRSLAWALQGLPGDLEKAGSSQHLGTFGDSSWAAGLPAGPPC